MNSTFFETAKQLLNDPVHMAQVEAELSAKQKKFDSFVCSTKFEAMRQSLLRAPSGTSIDSEQCSYQREEVNATLGWNAYSEDDVNMFFRAMANSNSAEVDQKSLHSDDDNPFDNHHFINYNLHVFVMQGQGTFIRITNASQNEI